MRRMCAGAIAALAFLAAACGDNPASETPTQPAIPPPLPPPPPIQQVYATPLQARIGQLIAGRKARGEPIPAVSFEFSSPQGASLSELQSRRYGPGEGYSYTARTVIHYDGPAQAGLQRWAPLTLSPGASRTLKMESRELRDRYVAKREKAWPGFWNRYELGSEPRTYTVTEKFWVVYPDLQSLALTDVLPPTSSQDEFVLGFSVVGPGLGDTLSFGWEDVEEAVFSFALDWGVGVRLPLLVGLDGPGPMDEGSTYDATSTVQGLDWSDADFGAAGIPSAKIRDGKEAYLYFVAEACAGVSGLVDYEYCEGPNVGDAVDFATPLGAGLTVPFPTLSVPLIDAYGFAGINLDVTPEAGSDRLTAAWGVSAVAGEASGGGDLEYSSAGSPVSLSDIVAVDGPADASFSIDGFRYHFTEFKVKPGVKLWVDVPLLVTSWVDDWTIPLGEYDLTNLIGSTGLDVAVGVHDGTSPTGLGLDVAVVNVAPTADIALAGGQEMSVNGVATVFGNVGGDLTFTGSSLDPGRDSLTLSWDWGDGGVAPDVSAFYRLLGETGPNNASNVQSHVFGQACMYDVTFKSVDDDAAVGEDHVTLLVTGVDNAARMEGHWQHHLRQGDASLDAAAVACLLAVVEHVSAVFNEARDISTMDSAFAVVNARQNSGSETEKLDRDLLVAWLNFASGAIGYDQLVDMDADGSGDTPFHVVMGSAETVRLDPQATPAALKQSADMVHAISAQFTQDVTP